MKLIYFANIRFPTERAHGAQIAKMCEAFADAGASVTLVVPNRAVTIKEDPYTYYGVKRNFELIKLGKLSDPQSGIGYWIAFLAFVLRLPQFCATHQADVYYSRDESIVFLLSLIGKRTVWEAHGWKDGMSIRYVLNTVGKIIAITSIAKKRFIESGALEQKIIVAPDGVDDALLALDIDKASARAKLGLPAHGTFAFYIGLLDEWKGYRTLLQCVDALAERNITVVIVGGILKGLPEEFPKAIFLGHTPYKELATVQAAADVLAIPNSAKSIVSAEYTSPLKLFAHMASGRPIIASDLPSLREILDDDTAYFFEPDNPESLTAAITYVTAHAEEADEKARKALFVVRKYTWKERARRILSFVRVETSQVDNI